jgi:hypothetical protein
VSIGLDSPDNFVYEAEPDGTSVDRTLFHHGRSPMLA